MVASLVQEAGVDIWAEGQLNFVERTTLVNEADKAIGQELASHGLPSPIYPCTQPLRRGAKQSLISF